MRPAVIKVEEDFSVDSKVPCLGAHPLYRRFDPARVRRD